MTLLGAVSLSTFLVSPLGRAGIRHHCPHSLMSAPCVHLCFLCVSKVGQNSQLWEGRKEVVLTSLPSAQILGPNSCGRVATWANTSQVVRKGEEIVILCDTRETIWTLASTKENGD